MVQLNFSAAPQPEQQITDTWSVTDSKLASIAAHTQQQLIAIDFNNPQEYQVLQFLSAYQAMMFAEGLPALPMEQFYSIEAFERWKVLLAEEVAEGCKTPPVFSAILPGSIFVKPLTPFHCDKLDMDVVTFADRVTRAAELKNLWLSQNDPNVKRAKLNREAQRRYQLRMKNDGSPESEHAKIVKDAYQEYIDACKSRKENAEQWDEYVRQVTEQARQQRAHAMSQWAQIVADKKAAWEKLRSESQ